MHVRIELAVQENATPVISKRLEQDWIHPRIRLAPCSNSLDCLCHGNDSGIIRLYVLVYRIKVGGHVLCLEQDDQIAIIRKYPAETSHQSALACPWRCTLHHKEF